MENTTAALEITSSQLKLVIGYVYEGKVVVLYSLTRPIQNIVEAGNIINQEALINELKDISHIKDSNVKLKIGFNEVVLVLPPLGLDVYETQKTTNVVATSGIIDRVDIYNVALQVMNEPIPYGNTLIDVVPERFLLDQGRQFIKPPLGEKTTTLTADELAYALPNKIVVGYRKALLAAGIKIKREFAAPYAAAELLDSYSDKRIENIYLNVEIGSKITTVSIINKNLCIGSSYFLKGGDDITFDLMNTFGLSFTAAEKLKRRYGYCEEAFSFDLPVELEEANDEYADFTMSEFNGVIKKNLDDFLYAFKNCVSCLFQNHGENAENYENMPLIITGGGSRLIGLVAYLDKALPKQKSIVTIVPTSLGARSQSYINCLGAILGSGICRGTLSENKLDVTKVERNVAPEQEKSTNKTNVEKDNHDEL